MISMSFVTTVIVMVISMIIMVISMIVAIMVVAIMVVVVVVLVLFSFMLTFFLVKVEVWIPIDPVETNTDVTMPGLPQGAKGPLTR